MTIYLNMMILKAEKEDWQRVRRKRIKNLSRCKIEGKRWNLFNEEATNKDKSKWVVFYIGKRM